MNRTTTTSGIVVLVLVAGAWLLVQENDRAALPAVSDTSAANEPTPKPVAPPASRKSASTQKSEPANPTVMEPALDSDFFRNKIQQRLNALADAYNEGDSDAAFNALDDNHAVVRPDGRTLYASDVLAQWTIEWTQLKDRSLTFEVEAVEEEGDILTARWTVDLIAIVTGDDSQEHDFEFNGTQVAVYRKDGDELQLQEPIRYVRVYQTIDGHSVNPHQ